MITDVLRQACEHAVDDNLLGALLLDAPTLMGVESIQVDVVTLRLVARTLPGKQFEAGRRLRALVVRALAQVGVDTAREAPVTVGAIDQPATVDGAEHETQGPEK
jgi:small conductance mechanosensitive channel